MASFRILSFGLLCIPVLHLFFPFRLFGKQKPELTYNARWVWGSVFICMLLFLSIQLTAYHEKRIAYPFPLEEWAKHAQLKLTSSFHTLRLTETERSVLATITFGDRSSMSKEVRQQFSITGVAHILSVSGFHVAIVCGFLLRILSFLSGNSAGRWIRYLLTLLLLWTFTIISGLASASIRAAVMLTLHLTGKQLNRTTDGYNVLAASAFCMLVCNPFYLYDIGFQLSYIAVGFILYLQPRLSRLIQAKNPILKTPWEWITLTLAAQTGVTLLCLYYFGQFSTVFLLTNLPLTLIATLLIPVALLWIWLPAGFPGCIILQSVVETLTHSMMWIVDTFSRIQGNTLSFRFDFTTMILCYGALFLLFVYYKEKRYTGLLFASLLLILFVVVRKIFYLFL
ncbi:MAG: ComEC/Rec2 family competence protein [Tannerellaceae bacterium]|jgi:competence protein ComEC|nr:ComEC/Rec2 family competence protein [Tannerellaceae bacterium]